MTHKLHDQVDAMKQLIHGYHPISLVGDGGNME